MNPRLWKLDSKTGEYVRYGKQIEVMNQLSAMLYDYCLKKNLAPDDLRELGLDRLDHNIENRQ